MILQFGWKGGRGVKVLCGGEALPRELAQELLTRAGSVWNVYGPTETTIWSTLERVRSAERIISLGRPIANTQVYVLDANPSRSRSGFQVSCTSAGWGWPVATGDNLN